MHVLRRLRRGRSPQRLPNCGGGFRERPIRPARAWREGTGLVNDPSGTRRRHTAYTREEIEAFAKTLHAVPPSER
jgi:hypothetical protein